MFPFVAMLVIIVAVLLCNDFHFEFSCHGAIIPYNVEKKRDKTYIGLLDLYY